MRKALDYRVKVYSPNGSSTNQRAYRYFATWQEAYDFCLCTPMVEYAPGIAWCKA